MQAQQQGGDTFDFQPKPKVLKARSKYREQQGEQYEEDDDYKSQMQNLMFDKRVVRGNTYAAIVTSQRTNEFKDTTKMVRSIKRPLKQQREIQIQQDQNEPGTPEPVPGRVHAGLQTDEYVEKLTDKPPNYHQETQTDFYIDRPLNRLFLPKKEGIDVETQIWDGDLFDFDYEVQPILQVLIGKTLEQSRMEVLEEEELRVMKDQQKRFEQLRNAELAEMEKLEAKERRIEQESQHRVMQYRTKLAQNQLTHKKLISRVMAKNFLGKLQDNTINILKEQGVFRHPLEMTLQHSFLPWLYKEVKQELEQKSSTQVTIADLFQSVVVQDISLHQQALNKEKKRRDDELERRRLEEEERQRRRAERAERKRQRLEQERRQKLKEQALEQLVSKGEPRPGILSLNIGDIDNHQPDAPPVGLFGGLLGEVLLFSSVLSNISAGEEEKYAGLKDYLGSPENLVNLYKDLVQLICQEGGLEIQIDAAVEAELQALLGSDEEGAEPQTVNNWQLANEEKINEVYEIMKKHIAHLLLKTIQDNSEDLSVNETVIDQCVMALLKLIYTEDSIQQKIKWVKVEPRQTYDQVGIAYMKPDLAQLQVSSKSEKYGEVIEPQNEDEEPKPVPPANLAEAAYEDKQILFPQENEEIKVLTQHAVAELIIREEILKQLSQNVPSLVDNEFQLLMDTQDKMRDIQTKVLDKIVPDFPVLDMESY